MRLAALWLITIAVSFTADEEIMAHGVRGKMRSEAGILVKTEYSDGEPMSYAAVEVSDQADELPFQTGRTDRNGCFLFYPDREGEWRVVVSDEMGHRIALKTVVSDMSGDREADNQSEWQTDSGPFARWEKVLMGLSIIFGLSGLVFWRKGRKVRKARN